MTHKDLTSVFIGIVMSGLAIFLFISLATAAGQGGDPLAGQGDGNLCGRAGAFSSEFLLKTFGASSYIIPVLLLYWAFVLWLRRPIPRVWLKIIGSVMLLFTCAGLENLALSDPVGSGARAPGGGLTGYMIRTNVLAAFAPFGGTIVCLIFLAAGLLFLTDEAGIRTAVGFVRGCGRGAVWLKRWISRLTEEREEDIETERPRRARPAPEKKEKTRRTRAITAAEVAAIEKERKQAQPPRMPRAPQTASPAKPIPEGEYVLPSIDLLEEPGSVNRVGTRAFIRQSIETLNRSLEDFGIDAAVVDYRRGPSVTMFELELAPGVKVHKVIALSNDLAMALKVAGVRVVAPIPGKSTVGLEVPNATKEIVRLKEVLQSEEGRDTMLNIPLLLGKDTSGRALVQDLSRMPHLLIAGTTGSGKSVSISSIILSVLYTRRPSEVNMILVDPKMVELSAYKDIPHLITPVVTDMKKAPAIFDWAVRKMDQRYELLARAGVRSINGYNKLGRKRIDELFHDAEGVGTDEIPYRLPHILLIVDELADLMMVAAKDVQNYITRLAQKSRAVGIHAIMATQRPSVDVITGLIKSNIPARIAFQVASKVDSRTIIDKNGAETLLGSGDMLFLAPSSSTLTRAQGTFVSDAEIKRVVNHVRTQGPPRYSRELSSWTGETQGSGQARDDLYEDAVRIVLESRRGSVSLLQRRLEIGYTRAARLIDMMAGDGLVGDYKGSKAREVLVSLEEWETRRV